MSTPHILLFIAQFSDFSDFHDMVGEGLDGGHEEGEIRLEKSHGNQKLWGIEVDNEKNKIGIKKAQLKN